MYKIDSETFTHMHLTFCMDDDIGMEAPVRRAAGFNIYLVDRSVIHTPR